MKVIIVAPVGKVERNQLENIENQKFNSAQEILDEFPNDSVQIFTLSEFMDACNNSDDDTPKELKIDVTNSWIGYAEIVENQKTSAHEFNELLSKHPYYCSDTSYYGLGFNTEYETFEEFYDEMGEADEDMNLIFRFDIDENDDGESYNMQIFMVHQRKGRFVPFYIKNVYKSDFQKINNYLESKYKHILKLWTPFSNK